MSSRYNERNEGDGAAIKMMALCISSCSYGLASIISALLIYAVKFPRSYPLWRSRDAKRHNDKLRFAIMTPAIMTH